MTQKPTFSILVPEIRSVFISPNPVNQNTVFVISIEVEEKEIILESVFAYCGMFTCGQEIS